MSGFALLACQKALYAALSADSLPDLALNGVFDHVPEDTPYPYITLGDALWQDWSTQTTEGSDIAVNLQIYSRKGGRKEALEIMARLYERLHDGALDITGHALVMMRCESAQVDMLEDGLTYRGGLRLRLLVMASA